MMAYEDPIKACKDMAKYTFSTHCKDHIVFIEEGVEYVCGVPYCATFKREKGTGGVKELGKGAFKIEKSLFEDLKAMQYYYPQEVSQECLERLLKLQKKVVRKV
ncbi:hypothetical protein [Campylobacter jejuni]|uniref:hypothetical protein n=1 Tax=Campylobacter jejuni TaxID=197 RepID=UPI001CC9FE72|nr:hypothetical protein [Campylobacter jejuni]EHT1229842.1 hypothetical protein [Campylobacter jejuni]MDN2820207.1 hypothetical protein [Campylobacter jejuni]HEB8244618.1 hypothetical protein [Campylobacter jejuni]HEB8400287.1 hypothetical protein [Campylobacter jejuni]